MNFRVVVGQSDSYFRTDRLLIGNPNVFAHLSVFFVLKQFNGFLEKGSTALIFECNNERLHFIFDIEDDSFVPNRTATSLSVRLR